MSTAYIKSLVAAFDAAQSLGMSTFQFKGMRLKKDIVQGVPRSVPERVRRARTAATAKRVSTAKQQAAKPVAVSAGNQWRQLIQREMESGSSFSQAAKIVERAYPGLRSSFVKEVNR
jgi:ribosomal protein L34E